MTDYDALMQEDEDEATLDCGCVLSRGPFHDGSISLTFCEKHRKASDPMIVGQDIPEGLYLGLTPDEQPALFDAQDVCWIVFTDGGNGDPVAWQNSIIRATCEALGVVEAVSEEGDGTTVDHFLHTYNGEGFQGE